MTKTKTRKPAKSRPAAAKGARKTKAPAAKRRASAK